MYLQYKVMRMAFLNPYYSSPKHIILRLIMKKIRQIPMEWYSTKYLILLKTLMIDPSGNRKASRWVSVGVETEMQLWVPAAHYYQQHVLALKAMAVSANLIKGSSQSTTPPKGWWLRKSFLKIIPEIFHSHSLCSERWENFKDPSRFHSHQRLFLLSLVRRNSQNLMEKEKERLNDFWSFISSQSNSEPISQGLIHFLLGHVACAR